MWIDEVCNREHMYFDDRKWRWELLSVDEAPNKSTGDRHCMLLVRNGPVKAGLEHTGCIRLGHGPASTTIVVIDDGPLVKETQVPGEHRPYVLGNRLDKEEGVSLLRMTKHGDDGDRNRGLVGLSTILDLISHNSSMELDETHLDEDRNLHSDLLDLTHHQVLPV